MPVEVVLYLNEDGTVEFRGFDKLLVQEWCKEQGRRIYADCNGVLTTSDGRPALAQEQRG